MKQPTSLPEDSPEDSPEDNSEALFALVRQMLGSLADRGIEVSTETRSMVPLLDGADRVFWRPPEPAPRLGDVLIYYQKPGGADSEAGVAALLHRSLVVHRLIRTQRDGSFRTKGDGRPQMDLQDVPASAVLGVVTRVSRSGEVRSLEGAAARGYGKLVALLSAAGAGVYQLGSYGDAIVLRLLPFLGRRRFFRAPAWWAQKAVLAAVHGMFAGFCLRRTVGPA